MKDTSWDHALEATAYGNGLAGHVGGMLLRKADQCGLTAELDAALAQKGTFPQLSRGTVLASTAIAIAMGATAMTGIEVLDKLAPMLGPTPSGSTVRRTLALAPGQVLTRIAQARARIRRHVWQQIREAAGFRWLEIAGKTLAEWAVIDMDGIQITAHSDKDLLTLSSPRRTLLFACGLMITGADEQAIAAVPGDAWKPGLRHDGTIEADKDVAEITDLMGRAGNWPAGLRWIARRVKPSRRHKKNMTAYEKKTGWKYSITCTNIPDTGIGGIPGSHHPQFIDVTHRDHAAVEADGVRTTKTMGLRNLPSKTWQVNKGWVLAANIAVGLTSWARLLGFYDQPDLRDAEPDTLRYRVWSIPARLVPPCPETGPQDQRGLAMERRLHYLLEPALHPPRTRLTSANCPRDTEGDALLARWKPVPPRASRAVAHTTRQNRNGHEAQKQAPARTVIKLSQPDSLRLRCPGLVISAMMRSRECR